MSNKRRLNTLYIVLILNLIIFFAELIIAIRTDSVALKADAFHVLSDIIATTITIYTIYKSVKPKTVSATYGWGRSEILGGFANSVFLLALAFNILLEAVDKLTDIDEIKEKLGDGIDDVFIVGIVGLVVNILVMGIVHCGHVEKPEAEIKHVSPFTIKINNNIIDTNTTSTNSTNEIEKKESVGYMKRQKINTRGLWLHIIGDVLGSIVVVISSAVIKYGSGDNRFYVDPSASLVTVCVICYVTMPLLSKCMRILMQNAPSKLDMDKIKNELEDSSENIYEINSFHVWQLDDDTLFADVKYDAGLANVVNQGVYITATIHEMERILNTYGIEKVTIQPELK
jgi:cation diffusion facilitator family transporter